MRTPSCSRSDSPPRRGPDSMGSTRATTSGGPRSTAGASDGALGIEAQRGRDLVAPCPARGSLRPVVCCVDHKQSVRRPTLPAWLSSTRSGFETCDRGSVRRRCSPRSAPADGSARSAEAASGSARHFRSAGTTSTTRTTSRGGAQEPRLRASNLARVQPGRRYRAAFGSASGRAGSRRARLQSSRLRSPTRQPRNEDSFAARDLFVGR